MKRKNIDGNTKAVSFKSVAAAKRYAKEKFGHLPRVGYEMTMVSGEDAKGRDYTTYLVNRSGWFRLWTCISSEL